VLFFHGEIDLIAEALRQDCPMLLIPYDRETAYNSFLIGPCGRRSTGENPSLGANELEWIIKQNLLTDDFRKSTEGTRATIKAEDGLDTACEMIERFLDRLTADGKLPEIYQRFSPPLSSRSRWDGEVQRQNRGLEKVMAVEGTPFDSLPYCTRPGKPGSSRIRMAAFCQTWLG